MSCLKNDDASAWGDGYHKTVITRHSSTPNRFIELVCTGTVLALVSHEGGGKENRQLSCDW